jgi:hypothetical protein
MSEQSIIMKGRSYTSVRHCAHSGSRTQPPVQYFYPPLCPLRLSDPSSCAIILSATVPTPAVGPSRLCNNSIRHCAHSGCRIQPPVQYFYPPLCPLRLSTPASCAILLSATVPTQAVGPILLCNNSIRHCAHSGCRTQPPVQ